VLRVFMGRRPALGAGVYVDRTAQIVGDVTVGDHSSFWMNSVVRGDVNSIRIGSATNIQDNCVVHVFKATHPTVVGDRVTVGHSATLHGCTIGNDCLIGMGATILNGATLGDECVVAAQTLVTEDAVIPPGSLVMGVPGKVRRALTAEEKLGIRRYANNYLEYKEIYLAQQAAGE
jgi:carbonic anhydrase/acetyltransferase-like protein (isoleucine patch superfamily)